MPDIYDTGEVEISRTDLWSQGILLEEFQSFWNPFSPFHGPNQTKILPGAYKVIVNGGSS